MKGWPSVFLFIFALRNDRSKKRVGRANSFFFSWMLALLFCVQLDRHVGVAFDKGRWGSFWVFHHFDFVEPLHYFFPQYSQLLFSKTVTKAARNPKSEGEMGSCIGSVNDQIIRIFEYAFISITRYIPHEDLVSSFNLLISDFTIKVGGSPHVG